MGCFVVQLFEGYNGPRFFFVVVHFDIVSKGATDVSLLINT